MYKIAVEVLVDHEKCTLCKLCVDLCPAYVFIIEDNKVKALSDKCVECYGCVPLCPTKAISIKIPGSINLHKFIN